MEVTKNQQSTPYAHTIANPTYYYQEDTVYMEGMF